MKLEGDVAMVTGATRGIGWAIAQRLAADGARVALIGRGEELEGRAEELGERGLAIRADVRDADAMKQAASAVLERWSRIDVLVNNAGVSGPVGATASYPLEAWHAVLETHLGGALHAVQAVLPAMLARSYGRIVNVASVAGKEGNPFTIAYSTAKAGLIGFTKSLGKELARTGVLVNCITPTVIEETGMAVGVDPKMIQYMVDKIPMGRMGTLSEVASMVAFVCSRECSFTTGGVFDLSGGRSVY
jgi:NAD(P)-dependent dehydrogenase (short-subunit alcohol dehydrogenase family)